MALDKHTRQVIRVRKMRNWWSKAWNATKVIAVLLIAFYFAMMGLARAIEQTAIVQHNFACEDARERQDSYFLNTYCK